MPSFAATVVTLVLGAGLGFIPTYLIERTKQRAQLNIRWDAELYRLCAEFTATTRQLMHATGQLAEQPDRRLEPAVDQAAQRRLVDDLHSRLRGLREQIRLIGNLDVQESSRRIQSHSFWVRVLGEGGTDDGEGNEILPHQRVLDEMPRFYAAVRRQLRVPDAEKVDLVPFGLADAQRNPTAH